MVMTPFTVGEVLAAGDLNEVTYVNTKFAVKATDTSRASTTTLTADPDLTLALDAGKTYWADMAFIYTATVGHGDLQFAFTCPAGAIFYGSGDLHPSAGSVLGDGVYQPGSGILITASNTAVSGTPVAAVRISGTLTTSSTAGSFTFKWAQATSDASATVGKQGSYMFLRRVS